MVRIELVIIITLTVTAITVVITIIAIAITELVSIRRILVIMIGMIAAKPFPLT